MNVESREYQEHPVFDKLDKFISFYEWWSNSIMLFSTLGTKSIINIDTYVYSSMKGTLESIKLILSNGKINDTYAILRKFHDSIIMNVYTNLYLDDNHSLKNLIVKQVDGWMQGTEQLPNFRTMTNFIKDNAKTKELYILINTNSRYDKIRERCNNNTHYNFYSNVMLNDNKVYNDSRGKYLDAIQHDLIHLVIMHLTYIFTVSEHYMISSDYTDFLDCGITPPEDSQYWVAIAIQEIFDEVIKRNRSDLAKYILSRTCMKLI